MTQVRDARGRFVKLLSEPKALTAAAAVVPAGDIEKSFGMLGGTDLQQRAWRLWRILGVLHFPTAFKAKQVGRLAWNVEVNGSLLEPDAADEAIAAITAPMSPFEASRRLALNLEVAAEVWYARIADAWTVLATTTPKLKERLKKADVAVRGWQVDPEDPNKAYGAVLAALGTAEQIRLMAALSRSQDRNRLAQRGILLIPKEGIFPDDDPFDATLQTVMTTPIGNEYAASAVVPPVVQFPGDLIDQWRHLVLESPYDDKLMDRIDKAITQLAIELDMPPEMLLGNMDSNHWNAWLSSEENYRAHVEPLGMTVGEVFAEAMMKAATEAGGAFAGAEIVVTPDPADLLTKAPAVADAFEAARLGAVGLDFVRRALGADEDDAPTSQDIALILLLQGKGSLAEPAPVDQQPKSPEMPQTAPAPANGQPIAASANGDGSLVRLASQLTSLDIQLLGHLKGAAGMAVEQVRERVGTDDVGAQDAVADQMQRLGRAWSKQLRVARKGLNALGIAADSPLWDEAEATSVQMLIEGMTQYVTVNLHRTDVQMPELPVLLLRRVLAAAGGSGTATVAAVRNPSPTFQDPQGFALGVLPLKGLKAKGIEIAQWRFRYGPLARSEPFEPHIEVDGEFCTADGVTGAGWYPGDHKGCECFLDPVFARVGPVQEGEIG